MTAKQTIKDIIDISVSVYMARTKIHKANLEADKVKWERDKLIRSMEEEGRTVDLGIAHSGGKDKPTRRYRSGREERKLTSICLGIPF